MRSPADTVKLLAASLPAAVTVIVALIALSVALGMILFGTGIAGALAFYFVVWWIMLFAVLPFGVRSQHETDEMTPGTEPGAPVSPALVEKAIWTTVVAGVVFLVALALLPLAGLG
jgi:predicted secreted protein